MCIKSNTGSAVAEAVANQKIAGRDHPRRIGRRLWQNVGRDGKPEIAQPLRGRFGVHPAIARRIVGGYLHHGGEKFALSRKVPVHPVANEAGDQHRRGRAFHAPILRLSKKSWNTCAATSASFALRLSMGW